MAGSSADSDSHASRDLDIDEEKEPTLRDEDEQVATATIAVDLLHNLQPVRMLQAIQAHIENMQEQARAIAKRKARHASLTATVFFSPSQTKVDAMK